MTPPHLGSTYRLQLHGLGLAGARGLVPYLHDLGIETLYLSPLLAAAPGSTHGYDVVDPNRIDPALGSDDDLAALLDELHARAMGAVLDLVPNHLSTDPANPWWRDVLARGPGSPHAAVFDIDWSRHGGRVLVPTLGRPLEEVLADGAVAVHGDRLEVDGHPFPIADGTSAGSPADVLARQHYRPSWWRVANGEGNYRRFFDIDSLVGVRVEDPSVLERTHRFALALSRHPAVVGLRVDHVDGLADPTAYLVRLRDCLDDQGPGRALLVEKILAHDEALDPRWPIEGTTGYEFGDRALMLLLEPGGDADLAVFGGGFDGSGPQTFAALRDEAKRFAVEHTFSGDLDRLARLTRQALDSERPGHDLTERDLRAAWVALTVHLSVYRTYLDGGAPAPHDRDRVAQARNTALAQDRPGPEVRRSLAVLSGVLSQALEAPWLEVARRWQQLTGAVMAKGAEDTATYRWS